MKKFVKKDTVSKPYITASDAGALMNDNEWKSYEQLLLERMGIYKAPPLADDLVKRGEEAEQLLKVWLGKRFAKVDHYGKCNYTFGTNNGLLRCLPDFIIDDDFIVECKSKMFYSRDVFDIVRNGTVLEYPSWANPAYIWQARAMSMIFDKPCFIMFVCQVEGSGERKLVQYLVKRDSKQELDLMKKVEEIVGFIKEGRYPLTKTLTDQLEKPRKNCATPEWKMYLKFLQAKIKLRDIVKASF